MAKKQNYSLDLTQKQEQTSNDDDAVTLHQLDLQHLNTEIQVDKKKHHHKQRKTFNFIESKVNFAPTIFKTWHLGNPNHLNPEHAQIAIVIDCRDHEVVQPYACFKQAKIPNIFYWQWITDDPAYENVPNFLYTTEAESLKTIASDNYYQFSANGYHYYLDPLSIEYLADLLANGVTGLYTFIIYPFITDPDLVAKMFSDEFYFTKFWYCYFSVLKHPKQNLHVYSHVKYYGFWYRYFVFLIIQSYLDF